MDTNRTFKGRVQHKHKTEANWILDVYTDSTKSTLRSNPFIPLAGELIVYDPDSSYPYYRFKFGNGTNNVVELPFVTDKQLITQLDALENRIFEQAILIEGNTVAISNKKYWANVEIGSTANTNTIPTFSSDFKVNIGNNSVITAAADKAISLPTGKYAWHDILSFGTNGHPTVEISSNNGTWTESTDDTLKKKLFIQREDQTVNVLSDSIPAIRWTWYNRQFHACQASYLNIGFAYSASQATFDILFETSQDGATWTTGFTKTGVKYTSAPYWFYLNTSWGNQYYVRLTLTRTSAAGTSAAISGIKLLSARWGNQGRGAEYEKPYDWDYNQNIYPRTNNSATLGTSSYKWNNVYATTFTGNLTGVASEASKARAVSWLVNGTETGVAGSATQPIYWKDGIPVATTYTLAKSVPSDAQFTDTTYDVVKDDSTKAGLISTETYTQVKTMWNLWSADGTEDTLVNKIQEILKVFENYPEANNLTTVLSGKAPTSHASAATTYGAASASNYGHAMASSTTPKANGTAAVGSETAKFARGDHVHPLQTSVSGSSGSCTGNAASATKLAEGRTLKVNLASTNASTAFNGTAAIADIGVAGTLGVGNGGTGKSSWTAGQVVYASSANALAQITMTENNMASTLVKRDASGNFSAAAVTTTQVSVGDGSATMKYDTTGQCIRFVIN